MSSHCFKLLKRLPNLKSLGISSPLGEALALYSKDSPTTLDLIEFYDCYTNMDGLEHFIKYCPKLNLSAWMSHGKM